jgi:hypothetical protein
MFAHLLPERVHEDRATRSSARVEETYAEDFSRLLRLRRTAAREEQRAKRKRKGALADS